MKTHPRGSADATRHAHRPSGRAWLCLAALLTWPVLRAQTTPVGGIARNVTMTDRTTGSPVRLYDFVGQVVLLDFFAYWCGPCQASSPDVEQNIKKYYDARGGNARGVPVKVVAVNIENDNESATDQFIRNAGLEYVLNDYSGAAYHQFGTGYIPLFVIINGVAASPSHLQWQVLYSDSGYPGATALRAIMDRVEPSDPTAPPRVMTPPVAQLLAVGETIQLTVQATGGPPLRYQWYRDGLALAGATAASYQRLNAQLPDCGRYLVEVSNDFGTVRSTEVNVRVAEPGPSRTFRYSGNPINIPDANENGINSQILVNETLAVLRLKISYRIIHPYRGDLRVVLRAPGGTSFVLADYSNDAAGNLIVTGRSLTAFTGLPAQGTWRLNVSDGYEDDVGRLESWSLEITPPLPSLSEAFTQWMQSFSSLTEAERAPAADPDGDGLLNLFEYVLDGHSPVVSAPGPRLTAPAGAPDCFEYALAWRPGVDVRSCKVFLSEGLGLGAWQEAVTRGGDISVDRTDSSRLVIRCRRSLPQVYLQLRAGP